MCSFKHVLPFVLFSYKKHKISRARLSNLLFIATLMFLPYRKIKEKSMSLFLRMVDSDVILWLENVFIKKKMVFSF